MGYSQITFRVFLKMETILFLKNEKKHNESIVAYISILSVRLIYGNQGALGPYQLDSASEWGNIRADE